MIMCQLYHSAPLWAESGKKFWDIRKSYGFLVEVEDGPKKGGAASSTLQVLLYNIRSRKHQNNFRCDLHSRTERSHLMSFVKNLRNIYKQSKVNSIRFTTFTKTSSLVVFTHKLLLSWKTPAFDIIAKKILTKLSIYL